MYNFQYLEFVVLYVLIVILFMPTMEMLPDILELFLKQ